LDHAHFDVQHSVDLAISGGHQHSVLQSSGREENKKEVRSPQQFQRHYAILDCVLEYTSPIPPLPIRKGKKRRGREKKGRKVPSHQPPRNIGSWVACAGNLMSYLLALQGNPKRKERREKGREGRKAASRAPEFLWPAILFPPTSTLRRKSVITYLVSFVDDHAGEEEGNGGGRKKRRGGRRPADCLLPLVGPSTAAA